MSAPHGTSVKTYTKRILVLIVGWTFIVLGVLGLFLPILQGVLFLLIGLIILSSEYVWAHRLLTRLRERFPKIGRTADLATEKLSVDTHEDIISTSEPVTVNSVGRQLKSKGMVATLKEHHLVLESNVRGTFTP